MKAYGLSRRDSADLDCAGIRENGRPTRFGQLPGPSGDARAMQSPFGKARARRRLKKLARTAGRAEVRSRLAD